MLQRTKWHSDETGLRSHTPPSVGNTLAKKQVLSSLSEYAFALGTRYGTIEALHPFFFLKAPHINQKNKSREKKVQHDGWPKTMA